MESTVESGRGYVEQISPIIQLIRPNLKFEFEIKIVRQDFV